MNNIILTTDSGMCAVKKKDSIIIPAQLVCNTGDTFYDNGTISNKEILENIKNGISYKTSSPLLGDFYNTFSSILKDGKDVIHLSMSSGISSGSVNGANIIATELNEKYQNQVYVIDSFTGATGGTLFYELAYQEIINNSCSIKELIEKLNKLKTHIKTSFYVPNIDGYLRSGRDKTKSHLKDGVLSFSSQIAKAANFKFRVDFHENGDLILKKIFRCSDQRGIEKMVTDIINERNIQKYDPRFVVVGNLHKHRIDLNKIKDYLSSFNYFENIIEQDIGSVIAAYGCNDLCGIALTKKIHI